MTSTKTHVVIPDTQVKNGVPLDHLTWIGQFIVDEFLDQENVRLIHLGDHWDMPSLSQYDEGKKEMEGRMYMADIEIGNQAFELLNAPLTNLNRLRLKAHRRQWWPESRDFLLGNHEDRISRAISKTPKLDGVISLSQLRVGDLGWTSHGFLDPIEYEGVSYAHYFYNPLTGIPFGGMIESRLKTIGHTFTMGHQQVLLYGTRYVGKRAQHGLVAGACYLHHENYKGPQGNSHWRGIIVKRNVCDGDYDIQLISLAALCQRYEGVSLEKFLAKKYHLTW